ncbi:helix-turn-helix domain-containing protein [Mobilicoccus caccae]|uniref:Transcriptional regulator n=1 Tax=Mobilicoccus caccae TaxID=1859295 RepID=A0ABQ6IVX8_9MICO|nr:XRE family transcriptional regulator [Mobilicoccus caccae]GMA41443.1 transcriptional regulator [Mobilicoccus caccae]
MSDDVTARSGPTVEFLARLGAEVRRRRKDAALTVQQLADAAGVSRRMLTQIELGQANPSLVTVDKLAGALATDFVSLTRDTRPGALAVNAPGTGAGVWSSVAGSSGVLQAATGRQPAAELWEWTLMPGDRYQADPDPAGSEELFLVVDGALTLDVDGLAPVTVETGGSARLASDRRYAYANTGPVPTRFVRVVHLGA